MAKIKVHEYAKQIGKPTKELVSLLNENGISVKSHLSNIDDTGIAFLNKHFNVNITSAGDVKNEPKTETKEKNSARVASRVGRGRPTSARSVGTAASVKKEVEKAEKAKKREEAKKKAALEKEKEEALKKAAEIKEREEAAKREAQRLEEEKKAKEEAAREEAERLKAQKLEEERKAKELAAKKEEEKKAQIETENKKKQEENKGNNQNMTRNTNDKNSDNKNNGNRPNNDRNGQGGNRFNNDRNGQGGNHFNNNRNGQGGNRFNNDRNGQGGNRFNNDRNGQGGNRFNNDRNGQGGNRFNNDRNGQGGNRFNNDRNGQGGNRFNNDRNSQGGNRFNNDRNSQGGNRFNNDRNGSRNNADKLLAASSVFATPSATKSSLDVGRSGRGNWSNRKNSNNDDYKYEDSKENFEALSKTPKNKKKKNEKPKKGAFIKPEPVEKEPEDTIKTIILPESITIKELADKLKVQPSALVKKLFLAGKVVTINQEITFDEAEEIALEYNCIAELEEKVDVIAELLKEDEEAEEDMIKRAPVVCVMGHVDHGKTSLLDAIRETNVTSREAGGITQHIGAYVVESNGEKITFLDTPGHEAFTSMRMRGAKSTDIAILVVAADDGVMPQTVEAINHAKAAGIEIIVAINKIDKPSANIDRVKQELVEHELVAEDWGGDTVFVPVSAHTHEGIDQLLEMILLTAEMLELKANPNRKARGLVIEAELDKGRGPVATVLVQKGTLHVGDTVAIGAAHGKVRAMIDDNGQRVKEATPSTPVEILGLNNVPNAGEILIATENDKEARNIAETFISQGREKLLADTKSKLSLDGLFSQIKAGEIKELNLIVKADVQGSVEAVKQSLEKLSNEEVAVRIIHGGVGAINESDVILASASNAIIIGFNVRPDNMAKEVAEKENVDLRLYKVIYNAIEDVEAAMKGMLDPVYEEKVIGHAQIRQIFKASGLGSIAGSYVLDGKIVRGSKVRISRDGEQIHEGDLASLKRFKDDVKEVAAGYECGLVFDKFNDIKEEDLVEIYVMEEVPR